MNLSVIIPVYNSSLILPKLVHEINENLSNSLNLFEVILVNDCSHDKSWNVIIELSKKVVFDC